MFKHYNMNQLVLPLNLEVKLQENDIAFHIHHLVESIPDEAFQPFVRKTGCPAYHPRMMLKIILCAYSGFTREFHVYECEDCRGCPFRPFCTKAKEGRNRKLKVNKNFQQQKEYVRAKLSEPKAGAIYRRRKIEVEPVFGCLKANLRFTRFSVRGKSKVENEMGFALMAVNLRKYAAKARGS